MEESGWSQPEWIAEVNEWVSSEIADLGLSAKGPIEQIHNFPWSTVNWAPTSRAPIFFKAVTEELVYEAGLTQRMAMWRPENLP